MTKEDFFELLDEIETVPCEQIVSVVGMEELEALSLVDDLKTIGFYNVSYECPDGVPSIRMTHNTFSFKHVLRQIYELRKILGLSVGLTFFNSGKLSVFESLLGLNSGKRLRKKHAIPTAFLTRRDPLTDRPDCETGLIVNLDL